MKVGPLKPKPLEKNPRESTHTRDIPTVRKNPCFYPYASLTRLRKRLAPCKNLRVVERTTINDKIRKRYDTTSQR